MTIRGILYPVKTEPVLTDAQRPEQVTESRWHQPLALPVRLRALATAVVVASGLAAPVFTPTPVEAVTLDKWHAALSQPVLRKSDVATRPSLFFVGSDAATDTRWFAPLSEPVRRKMLLTAAQPWLAFAPASPFTETVSIDRWQQPLSEPVRRRGYAVQYQDELSFVGSDTATDARWLAPLSEPVRRKPTVQPDAQSWSTFTPAASETVTLDKWMAAFSLPVFPRGLPVSKQTTLSYVEAAPFDEAVSIDRWQQPLSVPVRRINFAEQPSYARSFFFPAQPDVTVEKWHAPLSVPVRLRMLPPAQQPYISFVKASPFTESISVDRWQQPLSEPVRRKLQPYSVSILVGSDVATDSRWFAPLSEPVRRKATVQDGIGFTPTAVETVTVDKWFALPSQPPVLKRGLATAAQPYLAFVKAAPFGEIVNLDKWFAALSLPAQPLYAGLAAHQQPYLALIKAASFAESVSADRWFQPLSVPVLARVSVTHHPACFWVTSAQESAVFPLRHLDIEGINRDLAMLEASPPLPTNPAVQGYNPEPEHFRKLTPKGIVEDE